MPGTSHYCPPSLAKALCLHVDPLLSDVDGLRLPFRYADSNSNQTWGNLILDDNFFYRALVYKNDEPASDNSSLTATDPLGIGEGVMLLIWDDQKNSYRFSKTKSNFLT